jgi:uncharacterized protein (DUF433 family)
MVNCRSINNIEAVNRGDPMCHCGRRLTVGEAIQDLAGGVETHEIVEGNSDFTRDNLLTLLAYAAQGDRYLRTLSVLDRAGVTRELETTHGSLFQRLQSSAWRRE